MMREPATPPGIEGVVAPSGLMRAWGSLVDFCFPTLCPYCGQREASGDSGSLFCPDCEANCAALAGRQCARCSASVGPHIDGSAGCVHCRDERFAFEAACSLGPYREGLKSACLQAKMRSGHSMTVGLAQLLWRQRGHQIESWKPDLIVPVPHHWWERLRQFHLVPINLAETLARKTHKPLRLDILRKTRRTEKQALLPVTRRRGNLKGAFAVGGKADLGGASVLLVDDILTTGSTAHECAKTLKLAGAAEVYVAVIARASSR
jgi:ComF family protein